MPLVFSPLFRAGTEPAQLDVVPSSLKHRLTQVLTRTPLHARCCSQDAGGVGPCRYGHRQMGIPASRYLERRNRIDDSSELDSIPMRFANLTTRQSAPQ